MAVDNEIATGTIEVMDRVPRPRARHDHDNVIVLHDISWETYEALLRERGERPMPRFAYLDGTLEIMTTSMRHELDKVLIARLLEIFAVERNVELIGAGNTTFKEVAVKAGLEPDSCYFVTGVDESPHLAIEIVHTSGGVQKLEIYRRLGVREVWFWIDSRFWVYVLVDGQFQEARTSRAVPAFDLDEIARIVITASDDKQTSVVRAYQQYLQRES
jgi:Uma2 family endonuclease